MKIAAIAGRYGKKEIPSGFVRPEWIWVDDPMVFREHADADLFIDMEFDADEQRIKMLGSLLPSPVMIGSVVHTLEEVGLPFIRINTWSDFREGGIHELAVADERSKDMIAALYGQLGWQYRIVPDIPGMISSRILSMIINEAYYTLQDNVSSREEIDIAMRLGTNYPHGPFEWSRLIGEENVYELLEVLGREDPRYLPCPAFAAVVENIKI